MTDATLLQFAQVNDAAAATTKKLQKQAALAAYFRELADDGDLRLAVRFAAGRAFPATAERVLNVGGAVMTDAILAHVALTPDELHKQYIASGEIGEAMAAVWEARRRTPPPPADRPPITLRDLARHFDDIAKLGKRENKLAALVELLAPVRTAREAAYAGKIIFGDLRTGVQEGVLQAAVAEAFGLTTAQVQRCQLLVGDLDEVAVLARHGRTGEAAFRLFHPIQFMLATPRETAADLAGDLAGRPFFAEDKLDGIRAQVHKTGDGFAARVAIYTRTMDRTDDAFPDVVEQVRQVPGDFLLDGEIVPYAGGQVLPFGQLQKRLGRKNPPPKVIREHPCAFVAFDVLYANGRLAMDEPLSVRRQLLEDLCGGNVPQTTLVHVTTEPEITSAFAAARERRNEGIILKDPASLYSPGRRGQMWFKLKTHLPTLDCVVTAAETGHGKRRNHLSDYTFAVWDREPAEEGAALVNIGKAFSGVTDEEIEQLTKLFTELTVSQFGRVRQVKPQVVLEIACDQIQLSARHASGYALRFPRIKRVRWDKRPEDADRLARVAEVYESSPNFAKPTAAPVPAAAPEPTLFDGM
ncbi:MAG TPA: ATP-dependent DNA ligase [Humisphaera sp.]